jgi:hypothetical protein
LNILDTLNRAKLVERSADRCFELSRIRDEGEGEQADSESVDDVKKFSPRSHSRTGSGDKTPLIVRFVAPPVDNLSTSEVSIAEDGYQKSFTKIPPLQ